MQEGILAIEFFCLFQLKWSVSIDHSIVDLENDWNPCAEKYNNMQDQTQYPIVFFGFVDSIQKVSFEKVFSSR